MNKLDILVKAGGTVSDYIAYIHGDVAFDWDMIAAQAAAAGVTPKASAGDWREPADAEIASAKALRAARS